jgi:hypothetical protein
MFRPARRRYGPREGTAANPSPAASEAAVVLSRARAAAGIDIADELQINPSTATRMLDRPVRKQLVRRTRVGADRRVVRLRLTNGRAGPVSRWQHSLHSANMVLCTAGGRHPR